MGRAFNVAVAGATGAVGNEILLTLERRNFPVNELRLLASKRSVGKELDFRGEPLCVQELMHDAFDGIDIALFSAGADRSLEFAEAAVKAGAVVIDNSSAFRMDPDIPLVVPEVNPEDIKQHKGIIANPNCTTILMVVALKPLHDISPVKRIVVSTYQSASGAGARAMDELRTQASQVLEGKPVVAAALPHQIAFNLFSHDSAIGENGYCKEEMKMVDETRKIMHAPEIRVCATAIRVPVFRAHAESILIEQERKITIAEALRALEQAPGVRVIDDHVKSHFPMPIDATGQDDVLVGRIRDDISSENGLAMFICGDQLLKGAALNAVQIAELLD
ncbi:MAG: aspartate-semialdehyde dehydrogenase [Candidatus Pacebacteria bacterium]|nr:aspartate-semialdehyde dehydrogenase [Candidatus Paceibacterota bacterium]